MGVWEKKKKSLGRGSILTAACSKDTRMLLFVKAYLPAVFGTTSARSCKAQTFHLVKCSEIFTARRGRVRETEKPLEKKKACESAASHLTELQKAFYRKMFWAATVF